MNRLLVKIEHNPDYRFARVTACKDHLTVELYGKRWLGNDVLCQATEVLSYREHPELAGIYTENAWSAIGLAALVDIFATEECEDQTGVPGSPYQNWQATGNPDPSKAADF